MTTTTNGSAANQTPEAILKHKTRSFTRSEVVSARVSLRGAVLKQHNSRH